MPTLTCRFTPETPALALHSQPQVCYALLDIRAADAPSRPVHWAMIADGSHSMRIPIVDDAQFRELVRRGDVQEKLVDGVPVWQLSGTVPADMRAAAPSALDHVARAIHSAIERLDPDDRVSLVACAEQAVLLVTNTGSAERGEIARGLNRLVNLDLGANTDLGAGLETALHELRRARNHARTDRILLLTDGFTLRPERCVALAQQAAAEGISVSTVGLGGEFQEELLTTLADSSGGHALFVRQPSAIPTAMARELDRARTNAVRSATLRLRPQGGAHIRRVSRIRPALAVLAEGGEVKPNGSAEIVVHLGEVPSGRPTLLLLELLAPPGGAGLRHLAHLTLSGEDVAPTTQTLAVRYEANPAAMLPAVRAAAAQANIARLQRRAQAAAAAGKHTEAQALLERTADQLETLGLGTLAAIAREQAQALASGNRHATWAAKELTYATRRLGET